MAKVKIKESALEGMDFCNHLCSGQIYMVFKKEFKELPINVISDLYNNQKYNFDFELSDEEKKKLDSQELIEEVKDKVEEKKDFSSPTDRKRVNRAFK